MTTGTSWIFTRISETDLFCTSEAPLIIRLQAQKLHKDVRKVIGITVGLLNDRVNLVVEPPKKQLRSRK